MADKFLVEEAFHRGCVAHTFINDVSGDDSLYAANSRNIAWEMFKEAGTMLKEYTRDMEVEQSEWDCGYDVWQCDEDL